MSRSTTLTNLTANGNHVEYADGNRATNLKDTTIEGGSATIFKHAHGITNADQTNNAIVVANADGHEADGAVLNLCEGNGDNAVFGPGEEQD